MAVRNVTLEKTIRKLLEEKKYQTLKDILVTLEPADISAVFQEQDEERAPLLFRLLPVPLFEPLALSSLPLLPFLRKSANIPWRTKRPRANKE